VARRRQTGQRVDTESALSAVLFLYKQVLGLDIGPIEHVPRARIPDKLLVVLSREELGQLLKQLDGTMWLIVLITS
jgi:integrase